MTDKGKGKATDGQPCLETTLTAKARVKLKRCHAEAPRQRAAMTGPGPAPTVIRAFHGLHLLAVAIFTMTTSRVLQRTRQRTCQRLRAGTLRERLERSRTGEER